ncbi:MULTISPECIES: hypothetical protein [Paraburkholderia]|jgi:hypothetical protein|nr:hypothetical protein [Paraburkholderia caledonica]
MIGRSDIFNGTTLKLVIIPTATGGLTFLMANLFGGDAAARKQA